MDNYYIENEAQLPGINKIASLAKENTGKNVFILHWHALGEPCTDKCGQKEAE